MATIVVGSRPWAVDPLILQTYLPEAYRFSSRPCSGPYGYIDTEDLISQSELVRGNYVSWNTVRTVWKLLVRELERQYPGDIQGLTLSLREVLSEAFERDRFRSDFGSNRVDSIYPHTIQIFMCLAEISAMCRSRKIGTVLFSFFSKHGETIVQTDPMALDLWGKSIISAEMTETEKTTALREFLRAHPAALGEVGMHPLRSPSPAFMDRLHQMDFRQMGADLDSFYPTNGGYLRGFNHSLSLSRRPATPLLSRSRSSPPFGIQDRVVSPFVGHSCAYRSIGSLAPRRALDSVAHATAENQMDVENLHERVDALEDQLEYGLGSSKLLPRPRYSTVAGPRSYAAAPLMMMPY